MTVQFSLSASRLSPAADVEVRWFFPPRVLENGKCPPLHRWVYYYLGSFAVAGLLLFMACVVILVSLAVAVIRRFRRQERDAGAEG